MTELPNIDDLIQYATRYKPAYPQTIRGASEAEIAELEGLVGRELPPHYRQYLERMGHNDGGLKFGEDGYTDIPMIISLYRDINAGEIELPPDCLGIACHSDHYGQIALEFGSLQTSRVLFTSGGEVDALYAATFMGMLFRMAFQMCPMHTFSHSTSHSNADDKRQIEQAGRMAEHLGFVRHWFSDEIAFCGEREDGGAAIFIVQFEGKGVGLQIATNDIWLLWKIGRAFASEFRLKRHWI